MAEDLLQAGIVAAFTGRAGGTSGAPFATLNLGLRVNDDLRRALAMGGEERIARAYVGASIW